MNIKSALGNRRLCLSLTGLNPDEFRDLVPLFAIIYLEFKIKMNPHRTMKYGCGPIGKLRTIEEKLFYILFYLKTYPTFDVASFLVGFNRSNAYREVQFLLPVLETTLKRKLVLPQRKINSIDEFIKKFPGVKDIFIDGTERRVNKPKNLKKRNKLYSGKKKSTTRKTVVVNDEKMKILIMTPTKSGRRHDKRLTDKNQLISSVPPDIPIWTDTGFQGIQKQHQNTIMPKKATKNHPLTDEEKAENKLISAIRVVSEHAIAGIKRYGVAANIYRNHLPNLDDQFTLLSAGLWNYHLDYQVS
ncbi:MAG: transposase family protein [bacterium]|nr:transposase family protein [bacterium]